MLKRILPMGLCSLFVLLLISHAGLSAATQKQQDDLQQILEHVDAYRAPGPDFGFDVEVTAPNDLIITMAVRVQDRVKSLARYTNPPKTRGRSLLFLGPNLWVYIPGTRRSLRISPNQLILGGVSSADIARLILSVDYRAVSSTPITEAADVEATGPFRELRLDARGKKTAYARIDLLIDAEDRPIRAVFYTLSNRKLKTAYFKQYKMALGKQRPFELMIVNHLDNGAITTLRYSNLMIKTTPSNWFQPSYLPRL